MEKRTQFTFYRSFWDAVKGMPKRDRLPILEAIIGYALDGALELVQTDGQGTLLLQLALTEQGVTLSGGGRQLALTLSPEGGRLTGLADPAAEDEAVSKGYLQGYVFAQLDALRAELGLPVG